MLNIDKINSELQEVADQEREARIATQYDEYLEEQFFELQRQFEMMQDSQDLECFSPFETFNS